MRDRVRFDLPPDEDPNPTATERVMPELVRAAMPPWGRLLAGGWHTWGDPLGVERCPLCWLSDWSPHNTPRGGLLCATVLRFGIPYVSGFLAGFDGLATPDCAHERFRQGVTDGAACAEWGRREGLLRAVS